MTQQLRAQLKHQKLQQQLTPGTQAPLAACDLGGGRGIHPSALAGRPSHDTEDGAADADDQQGQEVGQQQQQQQRADGSGAPAKSKGGLLQPVAAVGGRKVMVPVDPECRTVQSWALGQGER